MIKGYRITTDVPQAICLGFKPKGFEYDEWDVHDKGGYNAFYQHDCYIIVTEEEEVGGEAPADMMVFRTKKEFKSWKEEME